MKEVWIVVHPLGTWSFTSYEDSEAFLEDLEEWDLNEEGYLKSRALRMWPR